MIVIVWALIALVALYWFVGVYVSFHKPSAIEKRLLRSLSRAEIQQTIFRLPQDQQRLVENLLNTVEQEATEDIHRMSGAEPLNAPYLSVNFWTMLHKRGGWLSALFIGFAFTASIFIPPDPLSRIRAFRSAIMTLCRPVTLLASSAGAEPAKGDAEAPPRAKAPLITGTRPLVRSHAFLRDTEVAMPTGVPSPGRPSTVYSRTPVLGSSLCISQQEEVRL